jgi:uncharacterized protein (DUF302 family)
MIEQGLITLVSRRSVGNTADALTAAISAKGFTLYGRVDFSATAAAAGMNLRPTVLILFGDPATGLPLIKDNQVAAIDLPMRAIIWEDENGEVWLTYPDIGWLVERHGLGSDVAPDVAEIRKFMANLISSAAGL